MIDIAEAERGEAWVKEAVDGGAKILTGGRRDGPVFWPTVLANVDASMKVMSQEIFAPVVCIAIFNELEEAIEAVQ